MTRAIDRAVRVDQGRGAATTEPVELKPSSAGSSTGPALQEFCGQWTAVAASASKPTIGRARLEAIVADDAHNKVIADFGQQWVNYSDNEGYYGSQDLFRDIVEPLLPVSEFDGKRAAEIGAGTGRICAMMLEAGAAEVTAVEPSEAIEPLKRNLAKYGDRVHAVHATGDQIPRGQFDIILSYGVLHHIPDPAPTMRAAYHALRPGGKMLAWLYGKEGNGAYLAFALPLRQIEPIPRKWNRL